MQQFKIVSAILVTTILAGCGGGGGSDLPAKPRFTSQVSFGDSLSDVGSYKVGADRLLRVAVNSRSMPLLPYQPHQPIGHN